MEILTRRIPYEGNDLIFVCNSVSLGELSLVPQIKEEATEKEYPDMLVSLLEMCLEYDPEKRPSSFEEVVDSFDNESFRLKVEK